MTKIFSMEENINIDLNIDSQSNIEQELESIQNESTVLEVGTRIENVLRSKIDNGNLLTDEEIYIAAETIGSLNVRLGIEEFTGFGFEQYQNKVLSQEEKSKIALEAISNQNTENAKSLKAKLERLSHGLSDYFSFFTGNLNKLKEDAKDLLDKVRAADDEDFNVKVVTDARVFPAINRGYKNKPELNISKIIKSLESLNNSTNVLAHAARYEQLGSGENSEWDLHQLAKDMHGLIIDKTEKSVTYDLNPENLANVKIFIKLPNNSNNNWIMRNIKANFVVDTNESFNGPSVDLANVELKPLNRQESLKVLQQLLSHIEENERIFKKYYKEAKFGLTDALKAFGKSLIGTNLVLLNSLIYRGRIQALNSRIHYINRSVVRGLLAWVASSMKK